MSNKTYIFEVEIQDAPDVLYLGDLEVGIIDILKCKDAKIINYLVKDTEKEKKVCSVCGMPGERRTKYKRVLCEKCFCDWLLIDELMN